MSFTFNYFDNSPSKTASLRIKDFNKIQRIGAFPDYIGEYNTGYSIDVEGWVNDTVLLEYKVCEPGFKSFKFSGNIDTSYNFIGYVTLAPLLLDVKPYKATDGDLKIRLSIY